MDSANPIDENLSGNAPHGLSRLLLICLLLGVATLAVYWPVKNFGFVDYDDSGYFFANPHVLGGLTWANVKWAFMSGEDANWHPLTWLSLMMDAQFFGAGATAPHVTNVLLHLANSILLFVLLWYLTARLWRAAAIAVLFAIHPMHVESVAWVAERKDVLSAFFGLLTLLCYARYAKSDGFRKTKSACAYALALLFFICGLMSKPMLVTMPFVLLLLDFWPLKRFDILPFRSALLEKAPFFLLSAAASVVTYVVQKKGGAMNALTYIPTGMRVENVFVSYARYLGKIFWPINLADPYPPPRYWPLLLAIFSVALFAALCLAAVACRKKFPPAFTGWFWFAGMLVPVIGLVQVGAQSMADRYVYLPLIGVLIIVVWGIGEICAALRAPRRMVLFFATVLFLACGLLARNQVEVWRDDVTLFGHALAVTENNFIATIDLGYAYSKNGRVAESLDLYHQALQMAPDDPTALYNVGNALSRLGFLDEAIGDYRRALQATPDQPDILDNLGFALAQNRQLSEAAACFQKVLKRDPNSAEAHNNLATVLFTEGKFPEAANQFKVALQLSPDNPQFNVNLGDALYRLGQNMAAAQCYQRALQLQPTNQTVRARLDSLGLQKSK